MKKQLTSDQTSLLTLSKYIIAYCKCPFNLKSGHLKILVL